jgi:integrase
MPPTSKNQKTDTKQIHAGLAIYKTGRSPFWHVRIYDPRSRCYVVRSTRENGRYYATQAALEIYQRMYAPAVAVTEREVITFQQYAEKLSHITRQRTKGTKGYVFADQHKILYRDEDGLVPYFGKMDIRKVTTGKIRDYLAYLDQRREKPMAPSTKAKQCIVIRKVLETAFEDGVIDLIPPMPKQKMKDKPRVSFTEAEFQRLLATAEEIVAGGDVDVRGVMVTREHVNMIKFAIYSFLRPTETELFGIRFCDVTEKVDPNHLEMTLHGKTGFRVSATLEEAVAIFHDQLVLNPAAKPSEHVFMPNYPNRKTAVNTYRRIFNHFLEVAGVKTDKDGETRSPYSLRHYALQDRLLRSAGKVNIYWLAENAGTSVEQLERFYLKGLAPSSERVRNIQSGA